MQPVDRHSICVTDCYISLWGLFTWDMLYNMVIMFKFAISSPQRFTGTSYSPWFKIGSNIFLSNVFGRTHSLLI